MRDKALLARFVVNGVAAATLHFSLLYLLLRVVGLPSAGAANMLAAIGGVSASFLGNRHFVFRATSSSVLGQAWRFGILYGLTTLMHGAVLFGWTDMAGQDYRVGFLIATGLQVVMSFFGNRWLVFTSSEK